jgi:hypothetical protein
MQATRESQHTLRLGGGATVNNAIALLHCRRALRGSSLICGEDVPGRLQFFSRRSKAPMQWFNLVVEDAQRALKANSPATPRRLGGMIWRREEPAVWGPPPGPYGHHTGSVCHDD